MLTDWTDTERQHLHTHGLQLSHGPGNLTATSRYAAELAVLLPCSMMWTAQAKLWFLHDISHLASTCAPTSLGSTTQNKQLGKRRKARIARRRSQVVLIRAAAV